MFKNAYFEWCPDSSHPDSSHPAFPPGQFPPGLFPPRTVPTRTFPTPDFSHPGQFPPGHFPLGLFPPRLLLRKRHTIPPPCFCTCTKMGGPPLPIFCTEKFFSKFFLFTLTFKARAVQQLTGGNVNYRPRSGFGPRSG